MKRNHRVCAVLAAWLWISIGAVQSGEILFSQISDNQSGYGPSQAWPEGGINSEIADDFEVSASINRVVADGFVWGAVNFRGVRVRFYAFGADNKPGALQQEYFLPAGDSNVTFDAVHGTVAATLSPPFSATGRHFLAVQPISNYWYWWSANTGAPRGEAFYFRDNTAGELWHHGDNLNANSNADVTFWLEGTVSEAGRIDRLSTNTLARSGYLEIFGANFGGAGEALIDGISAPVASWRDDRIVAYVPESARLTAAAAQVINASGLPSNPMNLTITARQPSDRVNWRFRMDGPYAQVRPVIGADGTVYAIDAFNHLYALAPDGGLKWLVRGAGDKGVAVGSDGTIYVASENFINAFNPDGSARWQFAQNPRAFICLGVSVGADGNIYSVGTEGPGVFSLAPDGALRWQQPEAYDRRIVDYGEIVFGRNGRDAQLYFYANNHVRALRLDGSPVFTLGGTLGQPAIGPDGSVHFPLGAYSPDGALLWTFATQYPYNVFTPPDVGSDGIHYFVQNLTQLFALNSNGSQRWHVTLAGYVQGPIVDPRNSQLVMGSANTLDSAGFILSASAQDGHELWRVVLPPEDPTVFNPAIGIYGFNQFVDTRARFTPDGSTAYIITATATGDNNTSKSFVYSLNTSDNTSPQSTSARLHSARINLSASPSINGTITVTAAVTVKDQNGATIPGAAVAVAWTLPNGSTQVQTASSGATGRATFSARGRRGSFTLAVHNISKAGYSFDRAGSVLSRSITK